MNDNSRYDSCDEDFQLLDAYIGGDSQALGTLLSKYEASARAMALRLLYPHRDLVDDIVQEANEKLIQSIAGFRRDSKFTTWYYDMIMNKARDYRKYMCSEKRSPRWEERRVDATIEISNDDPVENLLRKERDEDFQKALSDLQLQYPKYYSVFKLYYFEDLPHLEISEVLGISLCNAKIRLQRALEKLREMLNGGTFDLEIDNG